MKITENRLAELITFGVKSVVIGPKIAGRFEALEAEVAALKVENASFKAEIAALKARPLQKWAGVYVEGVPYAEASLVTKAGSLWVSTAATTTTPGADGSDWRLVVKRGEA